MHTELKLLPENLPAISADEYIAFAYTPYGAMGAAGRIKLFSVNGGECVCHRGNMGAFLASGIGESDAKELIREKLGIGPETWTQVYIGFGNHITVNNKYLNRFNAATEDMFPGDIYNGLNGIFEEVVEKQNQQNEDHIV